MFKKYQNPYCNTDSQHKLTNHHYLNDNFLKHITKIQIIDLNMNSAKIGNLKVNSAKKKKNKTNKD